MFSFSPFPDTLRSSAWSNVPFSSSTSASSIVPSPASTGTSRTRGDGDRSEGGTGPSHTAQTSTAPSTTRPQGSAPKEKSKSDKKNPKNARRRDSRLLCTFRAREACTQNNNSKRHTRVSLRECVYMLYTTVEAPRECSREQQDKPGSSSSSSGDDGGKQGCVYLNTRELLLLLPSPLSSLSDKVDTTTLFEMGFRLCIPPPPPLPPARGALNTARVFFGSCVVDIATAAAFLSARSC